MKNIILALTLAVLLAGPLSSAEAGVRREGELYVVDDAEGYAPIKNGNKNAAREEARREAYRDALEKALGATVQGVTEMQNYQVVRDKVFSQTTGLVKNFDILREWEEDGILYLSALCKVSYAALDGVLGPAVIDALGNPRIMILIDERIEGGQGDAGVFISATENETLRVFEKAGYLLVDPDQARALLSIDPAAAYNDPSKLMDAARTLRADVIILGKAYAIAQAGSREGIRLYRVKSTVQLKAVLTQTAYQIGSKAVERETSKKPALSVKEGADRCFTEAASIAS
ncbi:MAG: flagellar assembly protein T N-terminal domain-containing protein, partial [Synergistaceae bacterium]|nr:flagellar assembly protein T N-terminal domain-containing protein [Synergistaceae bacterium]